MMTPRAHHIRSRLASPSTRPPRGQGDSEDTGHTACLDHPAPGQTGQEGANGLPGLGAGNGLPEQPGSKRNGQMTVQTGCPHHPQTMGRGNRPIVTLHPCPWYFTRKHAKCVNL